MPLRDFRSLSDANAQLKHWILQTAGNRIHGTTKQKPLSAFIETEKPLLTALPDVPPELATWAKVKLHGNCHVQFEYCYYSAPFRLVHRQLWLKARNSPSAPSYAMLGYVFDEDVARKCAAVAVGHVDGHFIEKRAGAHGPLWPACILKISTRLQTLAHG